MNLGALLKGGLVPGGILSSGVGLKGSGLFGKSKSSPFGSLSGLNNNMGAAAELLGANAANEQYQRALAQLQGLQTPEFQQYGDLNQLGEIDNINNAYNTTDRYGEDVQKDILGKLQNLSVTGDTANAALDRQNFVNAENVRTKGIRDSILQREAATGRGGAGQGVLAQLTGGQNSALVGNQNALQTAANLQNTRMNAMSQGAQLGGQYTNQQFQRAAAQNAIDQYNNSNQLERMYYNNNMANESNTRKVDQHNAQRQQDYNNRMGKITGQVAQQNMMGQNMNQGYSNAGGRYQQGNQYQQNLNFERMKNEQKNQWGAFDRIMDIGMGGSAGAARGKPPEAREHGGPVSEGNPYLVGERGEELLVSQNGMQPIGSQSQEVILPQEDGYVIPHEETKHIKDFMHILTGKKWGYNHANS